MRDGSYKEVSESWRELQQGQYRFVPEDTTQVEVFFRRSCHGWSMAGLSSDGQVLSLACEGDPRKHKGHTLASAAHRLLDAGARDALLIDEGFDAFQVALPGRGGRKARMAGDGPELDEIVPLRRTRLRATFLFASNRAAETGPTQ
jgi:hypothetical protein